MKRACFLLIITVSLCGIFGCASKVQDEIILPKSISMASSYLSDNKASHPDITNIQQLAENSDIVVRGVIKDVVAFDDHGTWQYTIIPSKTFGSEFDEKQIYLYETKPDIYSKGDSYYFFLVGSNSASYPHIVYTPTQNQAVFTVSSDDVVSMCIRSDEMAFSSTSVIDSALATVVTEGHMDADNSLALQHENIDSFQKARKLADDIWRVTITDVKEANLYMDRCSFVIKEVLAGDYVIKNKNDAHYRRLLPKGQCYENGQYLLFFGNDGEGTIIQSREYCVLAQGDEEYEQIISSFGSE